MNQLRTQVQRVGSQHIHFLAAAGVLALGLVAVLNTSRGGGAGPAAALASEQPADDTPDGRVSAAEQRKVMIAELKNISARLDRIDAAMSKGLSVRVTEMPEMRLPKALENRLDAARNDGKQGTNDGKQGTKEPK